MIYVAVALYWKETTKYLPLVFHAKVGFMLFFLLKGYPGMSEREVAGVGGGGGE